jgi:DNA-binding GntR family transcriptional regulator
VRVLEAKPTESWHNSPADCAYREIEEMIATRALTQGTMMSENQLSDELKYGRTP